MKKTQTADRIMDAVGLECPQPVIRARSILTEMAPDALLEVLVDDPLAELDFTVFSRRTGHELISIEQEGPVQRIRLWRRSDEKGHDTGHSNQS